MAQHTKIWILPAIIEKVRLYAPIGKALIDARSSGVDAFTAIEAVMSWAKFELTVAEAQTLAQPEEFDFRGLLDERYSSVRRFAPLVLGMPLIHSWIAASAFLTPRGQSRSINMRWPSPTAAGSYARLSRTLSAEILLFMALGAFGYRPYHSQSLTRFNAEPLCIAMWSVLSLWISYCGSSALAWCV